QRVTGHLSTAFTQAKLGRLAVLALQLVLFWLVCYEFQIENLAFQGTVVVLVVGGFLVHYALPASVRLTYFLILGLIGIGAVFGPRDGLAIVLPGLGLIALCHLPVRLWIRVLLLLGAAALLAAARVDAVAVPWSRAVWPILGSMFMFRLPVYLYDLH